MKNQIKIIKLIEIKLINKTYIPDESMKLYLIMKIYKLSLVMIYWAKNERYLD